MSLGTTLGRAVGKTGALIVEGGHATGRFGADFFAGVESGYDDQRAKLLERRKQLDAAKKAALAQAVAEMQAAAPAPAVPAPAKKRGAIATA